MCADREGKHQRAIARQQHCRQIAPWMCRVDARQPDCEHPHRQQGGITEATDPAPVRDVVLAAALPITHPDQSLRKTMRPIQPVRKASATAAMPYSRLCSCAARNRRCSKPDFWIESCAELSAMKTPFLNRKARALCVPTGTLGAR